MEHLFKSFFRNAVEAWVGIAEVRHYELDRHGAATDAENLRGDFAAIGNDLRKTLKREQQTNNRTR